MNMLSKKWLKTGAGYEDWRDFWSALGNWANSADFTYCGNVLRDQNKMLLLFLASDYHPQIGAIDWKMFADDEDRIEFANTAYELGLKLPKRFLKLIK